MQPSLQDFVNGIDLSTAVAVSGTQLNSLVAAGVPVNDKGLNVITADILGVPTVPDAVTNPKWQTYTWVRVTATGVLSYLWSPNTATDPTYQQWVNQTLQNSAVGGALAGSLPNPTLAANAVTSASVGIKTIANTKLISDGVPGDMLRTQTASPTVVEWFTPPLLFTGLNESTIGTNASHAVAVNAAGNGYTYSPLVLPPAGAKQFYNRVDVANSTFQSSTTVGLSQSTANSDIITGFGSSGVVTYTPVLTTSTIVIDAILHCTLSAGSVLGLYGLYVNGSSSFSDLGSVVTSQTIQGTTVLRAVVANTTGANVTMATRVSVSAAGTTNLVSGYISIVEYK